MFLLQVPRRVLRAARLLILTPSATEQFPKEVGETREYDSFVRAD
jgi:hypothetical protein